MAPRTKTFKNCIIAYTDDIPLAKREKIKGWVEHAGGKISRQITDDVTHLILTRNDWKNYKQRPLVQEARRKKTIYLMRTVWLEDSLSLNKSKTIPLDECTEKYNWEVAHAKKVIRHREDRRARRRRETLDLRKLAAKGDKKLPGVGADGERTGSRPCEYQCRREDSANGRGNAQQDVKDQLGMKSSHGGVKKRTAKSGYQGLEEKFRQIFECGIKFDKSILETERNMALAGYRPFIDQDGFVYLITLVRSNVMEMIQERYQIKSSPGPVGLSQHHGLTVGSSNTVSAGAASRQGGRGRKNSYGKFKTGKDTQLRYLDDPICCENTMPHKHTRFGTDRLNDGQCAPRPMRYGHPTSTALPQRRTNTTFSHRSNKSAFEQWEHHLPFSTLPVMPYTTTPRTSSPVRVRLPRPFAYSLQIYESFDQHDAKAEYEESSVTYLSETSSICAEPRRLTSDSFTAHPLPAISHGETQGLEAVSGPSHTLDNSNTTSVPDYLTVQMANRRGKSYMVICQYTKKGNSRAYETVTAAPEGSTFDFAFDVFRKLFWKKTGLSWETTLGMNQGGEKYGHGSGNMEGNCFGFDQSALATGGYLSPEIGDANQVNKNLIQSGRTIALANSLRAKDATASTKAFETTITQGASSRNPPHHSHSSTARPPKTSTVCTPSENRIRADHNERRPFTYIPTDRKSLEDANTKYKAQYGEDLFDFTGDMTLGMTDQM